MVSLELTEELSQVQGTVREFAKQHVRPKLRQIEKKGASDELKSRFNEMGLFGVDWPESAGGQGLGALARVLIEEELAYGDVGAAFALDRGGAAAEFLLAVGTDAAHAALKGLLSGSGRAALALAEEGKAQADFRTTAVKTGDGWVLNGKKAYVLGGGDAALHVVLAQIDPGKGLDGAGAFLVQGSPASLRAGRTQVTLGLQAVPVREVVVESLKVPAAARLDAPGTLHKVLRRYYDRVSVVTAARAVGLASAAFEYARAYAEERIAFGKPIGHFQAIAFLLADMTTAVDAARLLTWKAAWAVDGRKTENPDVDKASQTLPATQELASAQAQALETAFFCANSAVQVLGGAGYVQDHPVEKWSRDAKTLAVYGQHAQAAQAVIAAAAMGRPLESAELFPLPSLHVSLS
jgi:alkylation response protein AidB-like acyl-CoA dehydrogenase